MGNIVWLALPMKNSAKVTMYGMDEERERDEERRAHHSHRGHARDSSPTRRASRDRNKQRLALPSPDFLLRTPVG